MIPPAKQDSSQGPSEARRGGDLASSPGKKEHTKALNEASPGRRGLGVFSPGKKAHTKAPAKRPRGCWGSSPRKEDHYEGKPYKLRNVTV
jgi:hypothetical protein